MSETTSSPLALARERAQALAARRAARGPLPRPPRRPEEELREVARRAAVELGEADAETVVAWAGREFGGNLAVACSMADAVLPDLVSRHIPGVDVLFLETGYHFAETLGTRDAAAATMDVTVVDVLPERTVAEQDAEFGPDLYARDPAACCRMRKMEPLAASLRGYEAWVTGVRRDEAPTRAGTPLITWDETHGLVKVNPLAAWSFDDLLGYAARHRVLLNPLLEQGYPSIGCRVCTSKPAPGADPRSGRWAGLAKTECGIHI